MFFHHKIHHIWNDFGPGEFLLSKNRSIHHMIACQESTIGTNIVSAVVAVIVLHLALGLFIYKVCQSGIFSSVFTMFYRPTLTAARRESSRTKTNLHCVVASISETVIQWSLTMIDYRVLCLVIKLVKFIEFITFTLPCTCVTNKSCNSLNNKHERLTK